VLRLALASRTDGRRAPCARHGERGWREHRDREGGDRQWPLLAVTTIAWRARPKSGATGPSRTGRPGH
jgi:hypothetical protein